MPVDTPAQPMPGRKRSHDDLEARPSSDTLYTQVSFGEGSGSFPTRRGSTVTTGFTEAPPTRLPSSTRSQSTSPPSSSPQAKPRRPSRETRRVQTRQTYEEEPDPWTQLDQLQEENGRLKAQAQRAEQRQQWLEAQLQKAQEGLQRADEARRTASSEIYALQLKLETPRNSEWTPGSSLTTTPETGLQVRDSCASAAPVSTPYTYGLHADAELHDCLSMPMEFLLEGL